MEGTGFSRFGLLYGRTVGELDQIKKELCTEETFVPEVKNRFGG